MPLRRLSVPLVRSLSLAALLHAGGAHAEDPCSSTLSPCFDANDLDLPLTPSRFASLEDASLQLAPGQVAAGFAVSYLREPVATTAASPDPDGRRVPLVANLWQADVLLAVGLLEDLQLGVGLPFRPAQDGGGIEAVTSRLSEPLRSPAVVDPRVALGWRPLRRGPVVGRLRLELKLPLGDEDSFGGASGPTLSPSFAAASNDWGPWHVAAEIGARLRPSTRLGDVRVGTQMRFAVGVRYSILQRLSIGVEAWAAPSLVEQPLTPYGRARHVPAEWHASLGAPLTDQLWVQAGAGTGLPLSSQGADPDADERDHFVAVTTPAWRALALVRFTD